MKQFDLVKKKVGEVNHRLKPLQDQIKKWKNELDKTQTAFKSKVKTFVCFDIQQRRIIGYLV